MKTKDVKPFNTVHYTNIDKRWWSEEWHKQYTLARATKNQREDTVICKVTFEVMPEDQ